MTTYCGTCGHYLDEPALRVGRCPQCGTPVASSDDTPGHGNDALLAMPTQASDAGAGAAPLSEDTRPSDGEGGQIGRDSLARWGVGRHRDRQPHRRQVSPVWAFALLAAVILVLAGAAIATLAHRDPLSIVLAPFTSSNASSQSFSGNADRASGTATPPSTAGQTPLPGGAPVPTASASPSSSPAPSPVATTTPTPIPTSTPVPPILSVAPTAITLTTCVAATTQFTLINTGGTPFSWTASPSGSYKLSPGNGSLGAGMYQTVTVSNVLLSGTVTVTAPTAQSSPQHVSITCTV